MKKFLILVLLLNFFLKANSQTLQTVNGVHTISYTLEEGSIYIYLPENIVENQQFSGSSALYPNGNSSREQSKNLSKLKDYSISINNTNFSTKNKIFTTKNLTSNADVSLLNRKGKNLGNNQVRFNLRKSLTPETPLSLPKYIANSVNTSFFASLDGDLSNTSVTANEKLLNVVTESTVQIGIRPENLNSTSSNIEIKDGNNLHQGQCNSIYYTLKIGPTNLKRGQSTFFDATIHGIGTIDEPLTYTVINNTTSIVTLSGGNSQTFTINPGDGESGNWFKHFDIRSISTGSFILTTNLSVPDTSYPSQNEPNKVSTAQQTSSNTQKNIDCRIDNQNYYLTESECKSLGGKVFNKIYTPTINEEAEFIELSKVSVNTIQDENEVQIKIDIKNGDLPEMIVSTIKSLNNDAVSAVNFITSQESSYSFSHKNQSFGKPDAAIVETTLLFSKGNAQTINTHINFSGNPFYSLAQSSELNKIRGNKNKANNKLKNAQGNKERLETERNTTKDAYIKARDKYRSNNSQFWYLWKIDQSLEKVRPAFADSLRVLTDSLKAFKTRTGGALNKANAQKIEDNLRDANKAHEDCIQQLKKLQQEQKDLTNRKETLKEQQKQIHREIMTLFRSTGMDYAGSTRRDKNGKFHYQYGVVTTSNAGKATFHKGSLPAQIASKVSNLDKQMKLTTEELNAAVERLNNIPAEIEAKNKECDSLEENAKKAKKAKDNKDALAAEDQYWNSKIDAMCAKIMALLNRLKVWAAVNDKNLSNQINNLKCGDDIWTKINGIINRKKVLEKGFEGKTANARRDMDNAKDKLDELGDKIDDAKDTIRNTQQELLAIQEAEAKAAAEALAQDQEKCLEIMKQLGYGATSITDVIDLYEISQDLKKAADEAQDALENLKKSVEFGEKHGMDSGDAKKWVKKTQERLSKIAKKLAKLKKYKDLAKKVQEYADRIGTLIGSDGSPTENAEAFGEGLKFLNEALEALADKFPILKVFTAYFTFITESYGAIMKGANDAIRKQYQQLLNDVKSRMKCDQLMQVCKNNGDDLNKIKEWAYNEYVVKPGYDGLRRDQTQAKKIISKLVEQKMAECCFKRLQAIKAAQ